MEKIKSNYKPFGLGFMLCLLCVFVFSGCAVSDKDFLATNLEAANLFGDDLKEYINNDESLSEESKRDRKTGISNWQESCRVALERMSE